MIIGIDIRVLGNRLKSGVEEYTENLLKHLLSLDKKIKYKLFFSSWRFDILDYDWLHLSNVKLYKFRFSNKALFFSSNLFNKPFLDQVLGGADIFFAPHFFLTSLSPACKRITTFHDLSYVHFPEFFSWRKNFWHNLEMRPRWQSKFSDRIIAVSESTKNDLVGMYQIDPAKIEVIYSGVSPRMRIFSEEEINIFRKNNNLPEKFILFLGKLEPRKNIVGLIRAFDILKMDAELRDLYLVIGGSRGWLDKDVFEEAELTTNKDKIIFKNYIPNNSRAGYYNCASVLAYPSFFEGFGFPPIEAMACGKPVIVSNNSSLPEVVGRGAILVDPTNIADIAFSIAAILKDKDLENRIIKEGFRRTELLNWSKTAEQTLSCLLK